MVYTSQNTMGGLGAGIQSMGSSISGAMEQRNKAKSQQHSGTLLQQVMANTEIDPSTGLPNAQTLLQNVQQAISLGLDPGIANSFIKNFVDISKDQNTRQGQQQKEQSAIQSARESLQNEQIISESFNKMPEGYGREEITETITDLVSQGIPYDKIKPQLENYKLADLSVKENAQLKQLKTAEKTIKRMKELSTTGFAGTTFGRPMTPFSYFGQRAVDRGEFEKLGQSLIPVVASGVTIRNQKEFDEYKKVITDPNARIPTIAGALKGLSSMVSNQLDIFEPSRTRNGEKTSKKGKKEETRFKKVKKGTLLNDEALVSRLLKHADGDAEKAMELAKKLGYTVE